MRARQITLIIVIFTAMLVGCEDKKKPAVVDQRLIVISINEVDHKFEGESTTHTQNLVRLLEGYLDEATREKREGLSVSIRCQIRRDGVSIKESHMRIKLIHSDQYYVAVHSYGPSFETEPTLNRPTYRLALDDIYDSCAREIARWNKSNK